MKLGLESLKSRRWLNNGYAVCLKQSSTRILK